MKLWWTSRSFKTLGCNLLIESLSSVGVDTGVDWPNGAADAVAETATAGVAMTGKAWLCRQDRFYDERGRDKASASWWQVGQLHIGYVFEKEGANRSDCSIEDDCRAFPRLTFRVCVRLYVIAPFLH